ncbi:MAG: hypothetical protein FJZ00_07925 [Candidatus Sericytochromatia bacterium]|uniref:Uncharacterized protein n=1 Tax=Candidatus Tanganyikabacteria bacterium TaxID=2961651 RepID=A0A937X2Y2_9BACT|nr:hypothetical protein [Candidatus Tanganyikabacteria bacterium]
MELVHAEFQARLSDFRLTLADRQQLQAEYSARLATVPHEYRLRFIRPVGCASLPSDVIIKAMTETLDAWAHESQERRGVLRGRIAVLSPAVFTLPAGSDTSLLTKADLVRSTIARVIANIADVEKMPGAELIRAGANQVALAETRIRLEDLMQARLDPLLRVAGRGLGRDSMLWIAQALEAAQAKQRASEMRAEAFRQALREYSGVPTAPSSTTSKPAGASPSAPLGDVQALTPQIDRTFIEGIVALSEVNTTFRQEITRNVIVASTEAASRAEVVEHYRSLWASMNSPAAPSLPPDEVAKRLDAITAEARQATQQFNDFFAEYSRVAFRPSSAMFTVDQPASVTALSAFGTRSFAILVLAAFLATPVILAAACLVLFHLRRYVRSAMPAQP